MRPSKKERLRIFVTGATGPYGGYFAKKCLEEGHDVFSIEHARRPNDTAALLGIKDEITWVSCDVRDQSTITACLAAWEIQAVAHFAALPLVRVSALITEPVFSTNVMGTVSVLEAVRQLTAGGRRVHFLHVSTDKVYGNAGDVACTEDTALRGSSVYETSKIAAEVVCRAYQAQGLVKDLVISRSCNVVGPADTNWRLIPNTIRQFLTDVPAKVFTSGQYVREYMHVEDAVEAQYRLLLRADEYGGHVFNIGSGEQWTQEEAIEHIRKTHFPEGRITRVEPPAFHKIEISYQKLDCSKIRKELGWAPKRTLTEAVADAAAWWREHQGLAPWSVL